MVVDPCRQGRRVSVVSLNSFVRTKYKQYATKGTGIKKKKSTAVCHKSIL